MFILALASISPDLSRLNGTHRIMEAALLVIQIMPVKYSIVKDQTSSVYLRKSKIVFPDCRKNHLRLLRVCLVGLGRFELPTSPLSGVRSNQLSYRPEPEAGDLLNANQALSQLSYSPLYSRDPGSVVTNHESTRGRKSNRGRLDAGPSTSSRLPL